MSHDMLVAAMCLLQHSGGAQMLNTSQIEREDDAGTSGELNAQMSCLPQGRYRLWKQVCT